MHLHVDMLQIHRRLLKDDAFGVGEALDEIAFGEGLVVRGSHYIIGGSIQNLDELAVKEKTLARQLLLRPWTFIQSIEKSSSAPTPYVPNSQVSIILYQYATNTELKIIQNTCKVINDIKISFISRVQVLPNHYHKMSRY